MFKKRSKAGVGLYVAGALVVLGAGAAVMYFLNNHAIQDAVARSSVAAEAALGPRVQVVNVRQGPNTRDIVLLGDAKPYISTTLFAKVSGYIRAMHVDKGDLVKAGQVLAEIDSAETKSQYQSAVADVENKQRLYVRSKELLAKGAAAQQTMEQAETNLKQAQESLKNFGAMRSYQVVRAPYDGTITARFADPGALLQAATTNQTSALPVVTISDTSKLRIGVYVEQRDVPAVHVGDSAEVVDASNPDRKIVAKISRSAGSLDPRTRTLYIEIDVDNREGFLVPGSFARVILHVPLNSYPQVPVAAVVDRDGQQVVAVANDAGTVKFRPVKVITTDGVVMNIAEGVKPGEKVLINIPNEVTDGSKVRPVLASR
jgi:RND family efflux transporter MFP subunit